jgi:hypothetical protein
VKLETRAAPRRPAQPIHFHSRQEIARMKKIKLDVEALAVDSFATHPAEAGGGTVHARQLTTTLQTNFLSCNYSAYDTCVLACECTNRYMRCKAPL